MSHHESRQRRAMDWRYRLAAWLLLAQGVLMELSAAIALPVLLALGVGQESIGERFHFALPYLQDNLYLMMALSGVFAVLRVIGAIGILRDRMWGLCLSVIMCVVTLVLMIFLLPPGIADGILSGGALVLILIAWFGGSTISARRE